MFNLNLTDGPIFIINLPFYLENPAHFSHLLFFLTFSLKMYKINT